ncbi:DUF2207 domain-containing protein [Fulvivirga lutea]|uniref:Uncharacterized protein n=1 Tax=Fulvivirga lutea TaxID=2810512 RepID=A0A974WFA9_9BACT|nr:hypothetical protein [Fulvivirga lutea]QSE96915.1 hypothetical protein JR347_15140 [Fulvivirga lutea]
MEIKELKKRPELDHDKKFVRSYTQFNQFLTALKSKEIPDEILAKINSGIEEVNTAETESKSLRKLIRKTQSNLMKTVVKELKMVPKNHYRNTWLAFGMTVFGIPLGVVFGTSMDNMGLMGIGLPIGMVIGMVLGASMDKKAFEEGRQLDVDIEL